MKKDKEVNFSDICNFTEKQKEASEAVRSYRFVLFGGALGGGKSYFLRWELIHLLLKFARRKIKHVTVGLFCEDYPSLSDRHLSKVKFEFPSWLGEYNSSEHNFVLKEKWGGGIIAFRNLDDVSKYQSSEFAVIAVDELTRNKEEIFNVLRTRLRWPGIPDTRFIAATNPGGIGHEWVKKLWIDKAYYQSEKEPDQFVYIPAKLKDNPHIDPSYIDQVESIPDEKRRRAYLDGNWDIFEGQYFSEWDKEKHVVKEFPIPDSWFRFRSLDVSGRSGVTSCHWYAVDNDGTVWVYREHYAKGLDSDQHAQAISQMSEGEIYRYTTFDNSALAKLGLSETTFEVYYKNGVQLDIPSVKNRVMGWDIVHQYMRWDANHEPRLKIFENCVNMIRTIPALMHDENNPDDVDIRGESHAADDLRYFLHTLRDQKTPRPLTQVQRRIMEIKRLSGSENPYEGLFLDEMQ